MSSRANKELVFVPLGGVGEIGMNFAMYGFGPEDKREWIVVDCGVTFPGPELPGVDLVLPDIRFAESERRNIAAIVITHAHEDHYGALLYLWKRLKAPVFMTPFTAGLLEAKRESESGFADIPAQIFHAGEIFQAGSFQIEAIAVTHSIPEPVSLAIKTPLGTLVHTGDWKIDHHPMVGPQTNEKRFRRLGEEGVLALICDSTNAMRDGISPSEADVAKSLAELITKAEGRVAVTSFSSNVGRIRSIAEAAFNAGRQVLVLGRSMKRVIDVATELGYLDNLPEFISEEDYNYVPRQSVVVLCTGSQGEPRAALAKLARDEMRGIALTKGDTVIYSSRTIPGNEKSILDTKNRLIDMGIHVIEDRDALVHVSGHPRRSELKQMYEWVKPAIVVPVHGEAAHLEAQGELATSVGIPHVVELRNGSMVRLAPGDPVTIDQVPSGRLFKDGSIIGDIDQTGINQRRKLSFVGHVAVSVNLDQRFDLADDPEIIAHGIPEFGRLGDCLLDSLFDAAVGAVESIPRARRKNLDLVQEAIRRGVRAAAKDLWGKKPITTVFVNRY
jgi:ribonuclease J